MSDHVDIAWIRDRLASSAGISDAQAGELIHAAMIKGALRAVAAHATRRPESSAAHHTDEDFSEEDFVIPQVFWASVQVSWHDRHPYFRFFHKRQVWLTSSLAVDRPAAVAFLRANDPLLAIEIVQPVAAPAEQGPRIALQKSKGGRPAKYDWAMAGGALAGHMHGTGIQEGSKLKAFMLDWFRVEQGQTPDERDVERFVAAAISAFGRAVSEG
ncbi:hypothetical protein GOFOIKOB_1874 [Methylobacterium tardum]|uniref:Uncharacterized protein n=1 Tax=Methylobacterium tardum TaxID=374432 RepID=A0AA37TQP1_9HYPH|nr:hypothetical protein [Methylobacterium tardum]URD39286.1 hypothetical protein M6G65_13275 [Methylobacterium tardum]GJE48840.1 hypothetical protein GOFOIKOB_1874 [Methylobacterium tardum]GLS73981.1 hypothetical protein GCM10007890_59960 [Methylobacterium tardum]